MKMNSTLSLTILFSIAAASVGVACGDNEPNKAPMVAGDGDGDGDGECADNQEVCEGICRSVNSDFENCGACGNTCGESEACFRGECVDSVCGTALIDCSGTCANLQADSNHCGDCDEACAAGQVCENGQCEVSCQEGFLECDGVCIDPSKDRNFCGASSCDDLITSEGAGGASSVTVCDAGDVCVDGDCVADCPAGTVECGGSCIDPLTDDEYCGATDCSAPGTSGANCGADESCVVGECREFVRVWSQGVPINNQVFSTGSDPQQVATDSNGNAIVIWREFTDAGQTSDGLRLFSRRFDAATKEWGDIKRVDDQDDRINDRLGLVMLPDGEAAAIWLADTTPVSLRMARYNATSAEWGPSVRVDGFDSEVRNPEITASGTGDVHLVWLQVPSGESRRRVHYSRFDGATKALTVPVEINGYGEDDSCSFSVLPRVTANAQGDAGMVFQEFYASSLCSLPEHESRAYGSVYDRVNKTWSVPSDRGNGTDVLDRYPVTSIDDAGNIYVSWTGTVFSSGDVNLYATKYVSGATWQGVTTVLSVPFTALNAAMSGTPTGDIAMVFDYPAPTTHDVRAVLMDSDLNLVSNQVLQTGVAAAPDPRPAYGFDGQAFVTWANGSGVEVSNWDPESLAWIGPIELNVGVVGNAVDPRVAVASSGQVYATWHQLDGGVADTFFARFD